VAKCSNRAADLSRSFIQILEKATARARGKFVLGGAFAIISWAALCFAQPANAQEALSLAAINATLHGAPAAAQASDPGRQSDTADAAVAALGAFAGQIAAEVPQPVAEKVSAKATSRFDDATYAALRDFAKRLGSAPPPSIKDEPKVAANSLWEALTHPNSSSAPAAKPSGGPVAGGSHPKPQPPANYVGSKVCLGCHATEAEEFSHTLMGRIGKTQKGKFDCENCHGPGSAHATAGGGRGVGGIISFRPNDLSRTAKENNAICLNCHERGDRTNWHGSIHQTRGLMCTNCHTIMKRVSRRNQLKTTWEPDTCFQCHKDRRAQLFRSSHMPIREGKIVCSDCHNPHGSFTEALLRGDSINDVCYKCHAEKRGPFLFEHEPVRENCDNCHNPHGSVNEFSLRLSRPRLCFECHGFGHGQTAGVNQIFTMGRQCQNCHTAIHGSNSPSGVFLQR
jgi:DmsE family decaheme c-type cytochrome